MVSWGGKILIEHYHLFRKLKGIDWNHLSEQDNELFQEVKSLYDNQQWKPVMEILVNRNMSEKNKALITKRSYTLAKKIKKDIDIEVFPAIIRFYYGSGGKNGAFGWKMYYMIAGEIASVYSNWSPKDLLLKKYEIVDIPFGSLDVELCTKDKSR